MAGIEFLILLTLSIIIAFYIGCKFGERIFSNISMPKDDQSVYAIFCGEVHDQAAFSKYQELAIPLAEKAGLEIIAVTDEPHVLEGDWPYPGAIVIEKFSSLSELKRYRQSHEYKKARDMVGDSATTHFAVVVDGFRQ